MKQINASKSNRPPSLKQLCKMFGVTESQLKARFGGKGK